jgi:cytochrome c55X
LLLALALPAGATATAGTVTADRAGELQYIVKQDCGSCHGLTLKGGLGRPLTREALADFPQDVVRDIILDGLPGTPMPPWRPLLKPEEAEAIADMLKRGEVQ